MVDAAEQLVARIAETDGGNEACSCESVLGLALARLDQAQESAKRLQGRDAPAKGKGKKMATAS